MKEPYLFSLIIKPIMLYIQINAKSDIAIMRFKVIVFKSIIYFHVNTTNLD